ncbi:hypothetical protein LWI28_004688 [Acer negundo]|uniref:Uncharacterized protein n=1 Tax=Acer negundo TaxID=4023 RepID=A0AAD5IDA4_ACENE|nr:hypothetical protein LWI28_003731 [Acer negundo]KAI9160057.1 hypothetical protein LWI28_004688 [Acer negundo]
MQGCYTLHEITALLLIHEARIDQHTQPETLSINMVINNQGSGYGNQSGFGRGNSQNSTKNFNNGGRFGNQNQGNYNVSGRRGKGRGRNNNGRSQCQICFRMGHVANRCYYRFDQTFQPQNQGQNNGNGSNATFGQMAANFGFKTIISQSSTPPNPELFPPVIASSFHDGSYDNSRPVEVDCAAQATLSQPTSNSIAASEFRSDSRQSPVSGQIQASSRQSPVSAQIQASSSPTRNFNVHPMVTRAKNGVYKPKAWLAELEDAEPASVHAALATSRCKANEHAQQLRRGGEFLTHVWLLLAHFGLTGHVRIISAQLRPVAR